MAAVLACGAASAQLAPPAVAATPQALIGPTLQQRLDTAPATEPLRVIVTFQGRGAPTPAQLDALAAVGVTGVHLRSFPIAGVVATPAQVRQIAALPGVRSVYHDEPLQFENEGATTLTGVRKLRGDPVLTAHNGGLPYTGKGVTVLVNDSGIDGTHPDLSYPDHVIQNVYAGPRGASLLADELACAAVGTCGQITPIAWQEDVPNTDFSGSHGTHVAGIVGATGAASGGKYAGVAPGASLIGYGSGAGLFILDALGGFDYAKANAQRYGIRIVTNSFGANGETGQDFDPEHPTNRVTQELAEDLGMIVVFSAGNSGNGENTITGVFKKAPWVVVVANGTKQGRLVASSSRGSVAFAGTYTDPERGITYALTDRPTVTAPGNAIISTRPTTTDAATPIVDPANPTHGPFYTTKSGTSMAAPHVAGIVALMLEANPSLQWREVKAILERTATNVADLGDWEAGAGYVNAYAAVAMAAQRAGSLVQNQDYGATPRALRPFNARAVLNPLRLGDDPATTAVEPSFQLVYTAMDNPVTGSASAPFEVGPLAHLVLAAGDVDSQGTLVQNQFMRIALIDPDGVLHNPGVPLVNGALSGWRAVAAPGKPGTWRVMIRGTCGLTGTVTVNACAEELGTNGAGVPIAVDVFVKVVDILRFEGMPDVAGHPDAAYIQNAIVNHLMDGRANGRFQPDAVLTRLELAEYLTLSPGLRQHRPLGGVPTFGDLREPHAAFAEAATAPGAMLLDPLFTARAPIEVAGSRFKPTTKVDRLQLAYSLVQALGLETTAGAHVGPVTYAVNGTRVPVADLGGVPAGLLGYVQLALDRGLIVPAVQGTTVFFKPAQSVTRAEYARAAVQAAAAYAPRAP